MGHLDSNEGLGSSSTARNQPIRPPTKTCLFSMGRTFVTWRVFLGKIYVSFSNRAAAYATSAWRPTIPQCGSFAKDFCTALKMFDFLERLWKRLRRLSQS